MAATDAPDARMLLDVRLFEQVKMQMIYGGVTINITVAVPLHAADRRYPREHFCVNADWP
jgi:hypothetical protein